MKSKENKINIEVNLNGTRFTVVVPFSGQDAVRATETEMRAYLKDLREKHSTKSLAECMAMMAYNYASGYFALKARHEADIAEAEDLLRDAAHMCGEVDRVDIDSEFGEFSEY
ncbi:MAG: cell division protein ZapA [Muribaculaceae bacterium]|nr:cell division protein ZapA [Muribaculaceae bacterium]